MSAFRTLRPGRQPPQRRFNRPERGARSPPRAAGMGAVGGRELLAALSSARPVPAPGPQQRHTEQKPCGAAGFQQRRGAAVPKQQLTWAPFYYCQGMNPSLIKKWDKTENIAFFFFFFNTSVIRLLRRPIECIKGTPTSCFPQLWSWGSGWIRAHTHCITWSNFTAEHKESVRPQVVDCKLVTHWRACNICIQEVFVPVLSVFEIPLLGFVWKGVTIKDTKKKRG